MTNKNKSKRTKETKEVQEKKRQTLKDQVERDAKLSEVESEVKSSPFEQGQVYVIMFLSVGVAKLMNIAKAARAVGQEEPSKMCTDYFLNDAACSDEGVNNFLRYKTQLAIQVLATVAVVALQCWRSNDTLLRYSGVLVASPVFVTSFALVLNSTILNQRMVWYKDVMVAIVLGWVTVPRKTHIPFLTGTKQANNTFQSLSLMIFCCISLFDMLEWGTTLYQSGAQGMADLLFTPAFRSTMDADVAPEIATVAQFFLIDKFTIAVSIFFAWFYLKEAHHRTLLFFLGATKFAAAFYQLPSLEDTMTVASPTKKNIEIGLAVLGVVAWVVPNMSLKLKSS